jgi:hypothetical protein
MQIENSKNNLNETDLNENDLNELNELKQLEKIKLAEDEDCHCPYLNICAFRKNVFKCSCDEFCNKEFTTCARFIKGCLKGIDKVDDNMKPIDLI